MYHIVSNFEKLSESGQLFTFIIYDFLTLLYMKIIVQAKLWYVRRYEKERFNKNSKEKKVSELPLHSQQMQAVISFAVYNGSTSYR